MLFRSSTVLDSSQAQTAAATPADNDTAERELTPSPAPENAPVLELGKIDNHKQEAWKAPLPQFIESIYFKRFKRENPETVKPLKQIMAEMEVKKKQQKAKKEERRKQRALSSGSEE